MLRSVAVILIFTMSAFAQSPQKIFRGLSLKQKTLLNSHRPLNISELVTYVAITHALEHSVLFSGSDALSLIESVEEVYGDIPNAKSWEQHGLKVRWKPGAWQILLLSGFMLRPGWGHPGEWGMTPNAASAGLHVLFSHGSSLDGHVHVDYRTFEFFALLGMGEGHFTIYDSDVRAIGPERTWTGRPISNYERHAKWYGPIAGFAETTKKKELK